MSPPNLSGLASPSDPSRPARSLNTLSIVIPAYKARYLPRTLQSLQAQTDRDFDVLVADDGSPEALEPLVQAHRQAHPDGLRLRYLRFEQNLGRSDLVAHWDRAVKASDGQWVLLLGDDDLLDPEAVAAFREALRHGPVDCELYRFDSRKIDADDRLIEDNQPHPEVETSAEFLEHRLRGNRSSYTVDHVFARAAFDRCGGFVSFPLAWCSDDASWIRFGARGGIRRVPGAKVSWRLSGDNISSLKPELQGRKLLACALFLAWVRRFADEAGPAAGDLRGTLERHGWDWLLKRLWAIPAALPASLSAQIVRATAGWGLRPAWRLALRLLKHHLTRRGTSAATP